MAQPITSSTTVRDAVAAYPGAEKVFDAHGLTGCGGPDGPAEPIGFFAAVHHVDPQQLIAELNDYAASMAATRAPVRRAVAAGGHTYPLFLTTALALALIFGITSGIAAAMTGGGWGALGGEAWLALVQAHGHIQVFGYLLLFIMGIALHVLPRFKGQPPPNHRLVLLTYWMMLTGVLLRGSAQPHGQGFARWLVGASAIIEMAGVLLFAALVATIFVRARGKREPFDRFIQAATAWLVAVAGINAYLTIRASAAGERVLNAAGDAALLEAAIYGFVVLFVLGISFRALEFFMSLKPARRRLGNAALVAIAAALPFRVAAIWAPEFGRYAWTDWVSYLSTFTLAIGVVAAVVALRVFESPAPDSAPVESPPAYRSIVQAAYLWLLIGVALDVYWRLREMEGGYTPFYAAGAIRHSFLLGFATLMIMAMAYRTVPVFSGRAVRWPGAVPSSYLMVIGAGVLRVFPVAMTPVPSKLDFKLLTAGGVLLFFGLGTFLAELATSMFARFAAPAAAETALRHSAVAAARAPADQIARGAQEGTGVSDGRRAAGPIHRETTIAEALALSPRVMTALLDYGFGPLADPAMRERMAPVTTIERAAAFLSVDANALVATLNTVVGDAGLGESGDGVAPIDMTMTDTTVSEEMVRFALKSCYDPEIPVNIVDLGLVYAVTVRDAYAHVRMTLTAPGCPLADEMEGQVREALLGVPGIEAVDVDVVEQPPWTPERMSRAAHAAVGW